MKRENRVKKEGDRKERGRRGRGRRRQTEKETPTEL